MAATVVSARGVARRYGARLALAPLDLDVAAGEVVALVGPNGAGKSTLLAILAGALPASEGSVTVAPGIAVGWAPQRPAIYAHLTPRENLELFARLARLADAAAEAARLLALVELEHADEPASRLSAGNQQRLNLALGLLGSPEVLLLDEPTASLDAARRQRLWELLAAHRAGGGAAVFATHEAAEVAHATRVLALEEGRVVA